jgi:hypothetical protein
MRRYLLALLFVLGLAVPAQAQLGSVPFVFTSGTVISSSEVNQNFSTVYSNALNRTGGTLTGTLNARDILAVTDNTYDIGSAAFAFQDAFFDGVLTAASAVISSSGASALDVAGGINAGSGNVGIVGTDGRVPAISSTYFASLSGANLTGILESAITDSTLLARVGSAETITASWAFNSGLTATTISTSSTFTTQGLLTASASGSNLGALNIRPAAGQNGFITFTENTVADRWAIGINGGLGGLDVRLGDLSGTLVTRWESAGNLFHQFGLRLASTISPSALSTGNNNNYAPTGFATSYLIRLDGGAGSPVITGLAGGEAGRLIVLCRVTGSSISITAEDGNSTAANRFTVAKTLSAVADGDCMQFIYDGTSSRWRPLSVTE